MNGPETLKNLFLDGLVGFFFLLAHFDHFPNNITTSSHPSSIAIPSIMSIFWTNNSSSFQHPIQSKVCPCSKCQQYQPQQQQYIQRSQPLVMFPVFTPTPVPVSHPLVPVAPVVKVFTAADVGNVESFINEKKTVTVEATAATKEKKKRGRPPTKERPRTREGEGEGEREEHLEKKHKLLYACHVAWIAKDIQCTPEVPNIFACPHHQNLMITYDRVAVCLVVGSSRSGYAWTLSKHAIVRRNLLTIDDLKPKGGVWQSRGLVYVFRSGRKIPLSSSTIAEPHFIVFTDKEQRALAIRNTDEIALPNAGLHERLIPLESIVSPSPSPSLPSSFQLSWQSQGKKHYIAEKDTWLLDATCSKYSIKPQP
jgi:hypothetical protein